MDPLEYIALFRKLLYISEILAQTPVAEDIKEPLTPIFSGIVTDITMVLGLYIKRGYSISEGEQWDFQHKAIIHQKNLDSLIERLQLLRQCSKCKEKYLATSKFFYPDKMARKGLRTECKYCYSKAKKEYYLKKISLNATD